MEKIETIREDIRDWYQYYAENIARYREMKSFNAGSQWLYEVEQEYENQQKEALVLNLSARFITRVVGEMLTNSPQIKITAKTENQAPKAVEMKNDLIRTICKRENFDQAKQAAFTDALSGGWGVISVYTEYAPGLTFDQEVKIETVNDATLAFFDPAAKKSHKGDGRYSGIVNYVPEKEFKRRWKGKEVCTKSFLPEDIDTYDVEASGLKMVQVADYYKKKYKKVAIVKVSPAMNGAESQDIRKSDLPMYMKKFADQEKQKQILSELTGQPYQPQEKPRVYQERQADIVTITCTRATYDEILEEYEWPAEYLPTVFIPGAFDYLQGTQRTKSYTEDVVDIQRFINYLWSEIVLYIRRAKKESFIGTPEMIKGYEENWRNTERVQSILLAQFDARLANGPGGGLPIPLTNVPTIPPVLIEFYQIALQTMMQIIGQSQASLGLQGNERSGIAIEKRRMQESYNTTTNYQFLIYGTEQVGLIINDLVNNLYDSERPMMLHKEDGTDYPAVINKYNPETDDTENNVHEVEGIVTVSVGSSYEQQRQEERDAMFQIAQLNPQQALATYGDLLGKTIKTADTNDFVQRLQLGLSPEVQAFIKGQPAPQQPPNPALMIEQQKLQLAEQANKLKAQQIQTDQQKNQIDAVNNLMDFKSNATRTQAEVHKAALETVKSVKDSDTHKFKHAADIMKNYNSLVQGSQQNQQNSTGGQSNAQPQQ